MDKINSLNPESANDFDFNLNKDHAASTTLAKRSSVNFIKSFNSRENIGFPSPEEFVYDYKGVREQFKEHQIRKHDDNGT